MPTKSNPLLVGKPIFRKRFSFSGFIFAHPTKALNISLKAGKREEGKRAKVLRAKG